MPINLTPIFGPTRGYISDTGDSSVEQMGSFVQGTTASFVMTFTDIDGNAYDPSNIDVVIIDPYGTTVETIDDVTKIETGEFAVDHSISSSAYTGRYTLQYTFTVSTDSGDETQTIEEYFIVVEAGAGSVLTQTQRLLMRSYLESLLRKAQAIPVKAEPIIWQNRNRTKGKLTFRNWNQPAGVRVYRNNTLLLSGYAVDYLRGELEFEYALDPVDKIDVDYNFRWFDDNSLDVFQDSGVQRLNMYPPVTNYTIGTTPSYWVYVAMWGSAVDAIRAMIMDLIHQEPQIVFGGPEAAQKVVDVLDSLKKNYEEELKTALDLKKYGPYTGLTAMTITPEYALPGGRCLASSSMLKIQGFRGDQMLDVYTETAECIYKLFEDGYKIFVLSDSEGTPSYQCIYKIWKSGKKPLIRITANNGKFVEVSKDHIMFVDGKQVPASEVRIGDMLTVCVDEKMDISSVVSIEDAPETETYDIEIPSTKNLFVNGIKCHNSRWFRYLFKGGSG